MKVVHSICAFVALAVCACGSAQSQGSVSLDVKLPVTFGQLSNIVELADGRVAFADTKSKLFLNADLKTGKVDTVGTRVDSLPAKASAAQYKFPGWVAHLGGDTVALVDFAGQRTTLWNERGEALSVLQIPPYAGQSPVLLYDTLGHAYKIDYQAILGGGEPGKTFRPDSIAVLRIGLKAFKADTVANLRAPEYGSATFGEQSQEAAKVFAPNDFFGVFADGGAWVARGHENRVDWRSPDGKWTSGKARDYTKLPVTQADRERVLAQVREQGKQYGMPQELKIVYPFADTKPPFDFALGRPNGEVWLQRPREKEDAPLTYDVIDRKHGWKPAVVFPQGATLAGFGANGAVYASIKDSTGRRTVGRFTVK
ncbi:MAG: hypothetical protein ABI766_01210 [Gemmatimonadales bacterium]